MILFSIGLPSRFTDLCDAITLQLARRSLGTAEIVGANTLEELAEAVIKTGASNLIAASRQVKLPIANRSNANVVPIEKRRAAEGR